MSTGAPRRPKRTPAPTRPGGDDAGTLTLLGYAESGGVRGAIAQTAESVFHEQLSTTKQAMARRIFVRLTELGEGTQDTRRRARLDELVPDSRKRQPCSP